MPVNLSLSPRSSLWTLRVAVVALAALMGRALAVAAGGRTGTAGWVATIVWGAVVAGLVVAVMVPSALGLTVVRLLVPTTIPSAAVAVALGAGGTWGTAAVAIALVTTAVAFGAETGEAMVEGSAYGDERRLPLKVPAALLVPIAFAWLLWCASGLAAVVLLGAREWVAGILLAIVATVLSMTLFRRFHQFSRRWLVVVPAGVVVHDQVVLGETVMVQTTNVRLCRLALADTQAADLTGPSAGHALEITVKEMVTGVFAATRTDPKGRAVHMQSFLVAPSRPGRALHALAAAKVPVG
ncbi:MAG: hypothetical protein WCK21_10665 [Actinomycetota bacterium]